MKKFALICTTLLLSALAFQVPFTQWIDSPAVAEAASPGQDGNLTVTAANTVVNKYGVLAANAAAGGTSVTFSNPGGANGLSAADLPVGSLILIMQMQGAIIDSSDSASYGSVTNLNGAGGHEFQNVASTSVAANGNITVNIACGGLRQAYLVSGHTQIVRVPQYSTLTVNTAASIVAPAWNGSFGGVVAMTVQGATTINGRIDVSGVGFRGAQLSANGIEFGATDLRTTNILRGGEKGEGIAGNGPEYDAIGGRYGRGAPANAGGGGTAHNSGGGGGANGNNGAAYNGNGIMDLAAVGAAAWALDPATIANGGVPTTSSGGGRGGYSYSDPLVDQNALVVGPGNPAWLGDNRRAVGGLGGHPNSNSPSTNVFMGGGGGAGQQNNGDGGAGGAGGGIVYLIGSTVAGTGQIRLNGSSGGDSVDEHRDPAGGGGGGGTAVVLATSIAGVTLEARGGNGGNHNRPIGRFSNEGHGPGAAGSGGETHVSGGTPTTDVSGGANGVSLAATLTEFPSNGATRGAPGRGNVAITSIPFACATDVAILKTSPSTTVAPGQAITYSIVARNNGPNPVNGATVVDTFPAALTNVSWTCAASAGSVCGAAGGNGNINTTVNLLVNGTATFTVNATVSAAAPSGPIANTSTIALPPGTLDPTPGNNTSTYTVNVTRGVTESLSSQIVANDVCIGAGKFLSIENVVTNAGPGIQPDNPGAEFTTQVPAQLDLIANSCVASSGTCTISTNRVDWNGSLATGGSVTITFQVRVKNSVVNGTRFCITTRANYDSNGDGTNDTSTTDQVCATADCAPEVPCVGADCGTIGPGASFPFAKGISDQAPGSVLIYPLYTSSPATPNTGNTRITLTNTSTTSPANVHLFFVEGTTCSISDRYVCLTEDQTTTFLASDFDPGVTGYLVAIAVDPNGLPISHNFLIGDESVKTEVAGIRFSGSVGAEAISALFDGTLPGVDGNSITAPINFNGILGAGYELVPKVLVLSNILPRADGNRTWLILDRTGGNLATTAATLGALFGILYDDEEDPASFTVNGACQLRDILSDSFPRTSPRFELHIPSGQSGWMKIWMTGPGGMVGMAFNANTTVNGFNGAHTLHKKTLTTDAYVLPIFNPSC